MLRSIENKISSTISQGFETAGKGVIVGCIAGLIPLMALLTKRDPDYTQVRLITIGAGPMVGAGTGLVVGVAQRIFGILKNQEPSDPVRWLEFLGAYSIFSTARQLYLLATTHRG
jgi:hypothetical protein